VVLSTPVGVADFWECASSADYWWVFVAGAGVLGLGVGFVVLAGLAGFLLGFGYWFWCGEGCG
jgi:hypothetical protein